MTTDSTFRLGNASAALVGDAAEIDALKSHVVSLAQSGELARRASEAVKANAAKPTSARGTRKARRTT